MTKVKTTSFKKGRSGNPAGKPKGSYSPLRKQLMELRKKAAEKAGDAFESLWKDFEAGDPLAKQIYFKELVSVPKEWLSEISITDIPKKIKTIEDVDSMLVALISKLLDADSISTDELHNVIKTLSNIKLAEQFGKREKDAEPETLEQYDARMAEIKLYNEFKRLRAEKSSVEKNNS